MEITPQVIKDQEFEVKFRGFDMIEVKAYLDSLADEFFELFEQNKDKEETIARLTEQGEKLALENSILDAEQDECRNSSKECAETTRQKDEELQGALAELDELKTCIADFEQEKNDQDEEISATEEKIGAAGEALLIVQKENAGLLNKIQLLDEQVVELRKEEVEFKKTLASAQKFAENVKQTSEDEAAQLVAQARKEVEDIRSEAFRELAVIPEEINTLFDRRRQSKKEVQAVLESYLAGLEAFDTKGGCEEEYGDLFQKITVLDDGTIDPDDAERLEGQDRELVDRLSKDMSEIE